MNIRYVTFEVSGRCNMDCGFCFSDWRVQTEEIGTADAKKCIRLLNEQGLKAINFTGGEPLARKDIAELINFSKQLGLTTILTTNGILLKPFLPDIAESVDFIGLPLDSSNRLMHNDMRPTKSTSDHYQLIIDLINTLHRDYPRIGIKINTIVTRKNKDQIKGIGEIIKGKTVSWKLSHFVSGGYSLYHPDEFSISAEEYKQAFSECKTANPDINLISSVAHERDDCCRIISATGHLLKPTMQGLEDEGVLTSDQIERLTRDFNEPKNKRILAQTYPMKR